MRLRTTTDDLAAEKAKAAELSGISKYAIPAGYNDKELAGSWIVTAHAPSLNKVGEARRSKANPIWWYEATDKSKAISLFRKLTDRTPAIFPTRQRVGKYTITIHQMGQ